MQTENYISASYVQHVTPPLFYSIHQNIYNKFVFVARSNPMILRHTYSNFLLFLVYYTAPIYYFLITIKSQLSGSFLYLNQYKFPEHIQMYKRIDNCLCTKTPLKKSLLKHGKRGKRGKYPDMDFDKGAQQCFRAFYYTPMLFSDLVKKLIEYFIATRNARYKNIQLRVRPHIS